MEYPYCLKELVVAHEFTDHVQYNSSFSICYPIIVASYVAVILQCVNNWFAAG